MHFVLVDMKGAYAFDGKRQISWYQVTIQC